MSKKVLFVSHRANFAKFNRPFMRWFKKQGYEVHYASDGEEEVLDCDKHFDICFDRSPYSKCNIKAYRQLKDIIDKENYDIIHCHTPMGSVVTRLAAKDARKKGTRVLYTAHGFHFYKGAPLVNWLFYYPIEKYLSKYTDCIITINQEDFECAKAKFKPTNVEKINGVGVDLNRFRPVSGDEKVSLRKQYGFNEDDFILIYVAEFTENKNHRFILGCLEQLKNMIPNLKVIFAGDGVMSEKMIKMSNRLGLGNIVNFLGYRKDIDKLLKMPDISISASIREGLGLNIIEGMACGLPIVATKNRGHCDIVSASTNGYLYDLGSKDEFIKYITELYNNKAKREEMRKVNISDVKRYSLEDAIKSMGCIYRDYM